MAGTGFKLKHFPAPQVDIWPDNWPAIQLYTQFSTQWRVGMAGATGLDMNVFLHALDRRGLSPEDYDDFLGCLRVIEGAALEAMRA